VVGFARGNPKELPGRALCNGCGFRRKHGRHECPKRFFDRFGFPMPGFSPQDPEAYDAAAWSGAEITPATAAAWRHVLLLHPDMVNPKGSDFTANLN
jgi:hypothetical protein